MLDTGPSSGTRPSTIGSMPSTYQRTPSMARSTSACARRQGLPISQTSRSARSSRCWVRASRVAATRARRSSSRMCRQARCWSREARTAWWAASRSRRGGPAIGLPSTGLVAGRARPSARQAEAQRLRTRSSRKASGATARQRCQASFQEVPDFTTSWVELRVVVMRCLRSRCTVGGGVWGYAAGPEGTPSAAVWFRVRPEGPRGPGPTGRARGGPSRWGCSRP